MVMRETFSSRRKKQKRRGHGEGTIYQRKDGRWVAEITLENSRRKSMYAKTRKDAADKLNQALQELKQGTLINAPQQTVEENRLQSLSFRHTSQSREERHPIPHVRAGDKAHRGRETTLDDSCAYFCSDCYRHASREMLALTWDDIDFEQKTITVTKSLSYDDRDGSGKKYRVETPKTATSKRTISLPDFAVEALQAHRAVQLNKRLAASSWEHPELVFTNSSGGITGTRS
jgi:integrase